MIYTCDSCHAIFEALAHPRACPACSGRFVMRHWKVWDGDAPIQMVARLPAVREATISEQSVFLQSGFATLQEIRCLDDGTASCSWADELPKSGRTPSTKKAPSAKVYQTHAREQIAELNRLPAV